MKEYVILDVDTGIDDALAISYAIQSRELEVIGLTTCFGNISVENATNNTLYMLDLLDQNIPVAKGASKPLFNHGVKEYSTHFHGEDGLANQVANEPHKEPLKKHAAQFMIEKIKKYPHEVTIICLGSLTNLALVVMQEPEIVSLIKEVIIMGGAIRVPGNNQMHAEANIYADPEAAELVFKSGANLTLVGLDVTMQATLGINEVEKWRGLNTEYSRFLADITDFYIKAYSGSYEGQYKCALHDPLAVAVAIDPSFVETEEMVVHVDTEGMYSYGRTIADLRERCLDEPNMKVCVGVDTDRFLKHFLETVV